jgi:hypothetical protein
MAIIGMGRVGIRSIAAPPSGGGGYTTRTTALISATGISNTTLINAINTFDLGIISNSLPFGADDALYLGVLGSNSANTYNFIDTSKYQLTLFGGWNSTKGLKGNGVNTYANTGWVPSSIISSVNNGTWGFYSRNNINTISAYYYPLASLTPANNSFGAFKYSDSKLYPMIQNNSFDGVTPYKYTGMFQSSRTSSSNVDLLVTQTNSSITRASAGLATAQVTLGDNSLVTGLDYCCTYLSANQWTLAQKQTMETLVTTFLTTLSLNV